MCDEKEKFRKEQIDNFQDNSFEEQKIYIIKIWINVFIIRLELKAVKNYKI